MKTRWAIQVLSMQTVNEFQIGNDARRLRFGLRRVFLVLSIVAVFLAIFRAALIWRERYRLTRAELRNAQELWQLQMALEDYYQRYAEMPPATADDISEHLTRAFPRLFPRLTPQQKETRLRGRNLTDLDDRESLVFWLGGESGLLAADFHNVLFPFDSRRLVDSDKDGWLEYVDRYDNAYRYLGGEPVVHCPETDRWISPTYLLSER
jgi:hypothetical protein